MYLQLFSACHYNNRRYKSSSSAGLFRSLPKTHESAGAAQPFRMLQGNYRNVLGAAGLTCTIG